MNTTPKLNILMFNMSKYSDWQSGIVNRNYHVLHNLAERNRINKILTVDFLPYNLRKGVKTFIKDQILLDTRGSVIYGDFTSRCWQISSKILVYSTIDSCLNKKRISQELNRIIKEQEMQNNLIIWNYNPLYIKYFDKFNQKLNIFDGVDNWAELSWYKGLKKKINKNYNIVLKNSDLIFTVSKNLKNDLFNNDDKVYWEPNGVDLSYFQEIKSIHSKLDKIPRPIIGFLGIIQDRIDDQLIEYLAQKNPDKSIVIAGFVTGLMASILGKPLIPTFPVDKFKKYDNVYFIGPIKYQDIPSLYNGFDVGTIPYKVNKFTNSCNPMKFYEYLATGLPVVSSNIQSAKKFEPFTKIAHNNQEFNKYVNQSILKGRLKLEGNLYDLLDDNTWQYRTKKMLDLVYEKL